ncbi:MAG: 50S ribosomal protein L29 [Abditibacteriaceae bacterium]
MADLNKYIGGANKSVKMHAQREAVRKADNAELEEIIADSQKEIFEQRTSALMQQLSNPMRVRAIRKLVARAHTELAARLNS